VDAPSLLSLADAKRLSGDVDQAKRSYVALRSRFQTSLEAGHAAFRLGEMEFSVHEDYADAALWFGTYLREQPRGAFAVQAQARLMESLYRIADWGGALRVANEYMSQHPDGPDSALARAILNDEGLPE
jgi:outer membrane protein assembly factor BamD (BamD/ComL family)